MQKDLFLKKLFVYVTMDNHPKVMSLTTVLLKPALLKKRHWSRCSPVNFLKFLRKRAPSGDFFYVFFFFFILFFLDFIQNETLSLVIKITQHIQINI